MLVYIRLLLSFFMLRLLTFLLLLSSTFLLTGCMPKFNYYRDSDIIIEEGDVDYKSDDYESIVKWDKDDDKHGESNARHIRAVPKPS